MGGFEKVIPNDLPELRSPAALQRPARRLLSRLFVGAIRGGRSVMGWKCPECRNHVYGTGKCPHCHPQVCSACGSHRSDAGINEHHVSYEFDITIPVCDSCHEKIHFEEHREAELADEYARLNPLEEAA